MGVTYTFSPNTKAKSSEVNQNFDDLFNLIPWHIDIDVFPVPIQLTGFAGISVDDRFFYGGSRATSTQNEVAGWDVMLTAGTWKIELIYYKDSNLGIYTVKIDGTTVGTVDSYIAVFQLNNVSAITGISVATSGKKRLTVTNPTKNASASGYGLSLQHIRLTRTA